jgi:hypothetical protein
MQFNFAHDFDIDVANYWKIFLSPEFNHDMFMNELKMKHYEVKEKTDDGKHMHRVQDVEPSVPIPGFMQSLVKSAGYREIDELDYATNTMRVTIETQMFKDRFSMAGNYQVTPLDGGKRCRREFKGEVKVSIMLIGGKVEKYMMEQLRDSYDAAAKCTRRWIEEFKKKNG